MKRIKLLMLFAVTLICSNALAEDYSLTAKSVTCTKGTTSTILNIYMDNVETISALQFDLYLPDGVDVYYGENEDEDMVYFINKGDRAKTDHTASYLKKEGFYRVMVSSPTNASFKETATNRVKPVACITLDVASSAISGCRSVELKNIVLSHYDTTNGTTPYYPNNSTSEIVIKPSSGIETSEANGVYSIATAEGTNINASTYSSLISGKDPTVIDLRATELSSDITAETIQNADVTLYYLPSSSSITGKNIVVNEECSDYVVVDGKSLIIPSDFTATNASYSRTMANDWGTICLPYAVTSDANAAYYKITGLTAGVLSIEQYDELPAGTPALVKKLSGSEIAPQATNVAVKGDLSNVTGAVEMVGSYTNDTKIENANAYYIKNNKFYQCNVNFYIDAFRAYFTVAAGGAKESVLAIDDDTATAINALTGEGDVSVEAIYDANGIQQSDIKQGLNIVKLSNGKVQKIMVK